MSPLAIAEWIEMFRKYQFYELVMSPLAIAEWIEIPIS